MRYEWIARNGCRCLILFFNGWGMDSSAVASLEAGSARCAYALCISYGRRGIRFFLPFTL